MEKIKDFFAKRLDEMNIALHQVFDSQELETGHHTSQTQVQRVARQLKKSAGSKMDTPRLMVQLKGLFDYIGNNDDVTFSSVMDQAKEIAHELLDSTPEHTVRDEYAQEVLDTLRGMAITLSDEQKAETAYHHDRYGNDLLFLYFASKSTAISTVTPKDFCFSCFLCKRKFGLTKPKVKSKIKKDSQKAVLMVGVTRLELAAPRPPV